MKKQTLILALAALFSFSLLLAGCGGEPNGEKKPDDQTTKAGRKDKSGD
jgi:hypothetical protein